VWRALILVLLAGCINQVARAVNPPPAENGTLSCREIVETCDSTCSQPLCGRMLEPGAKWSVSSPGPQRTLRTRPSLA